MRRRSFLGLSGACLVCGCAGAVHQLPQLAAGDVGAARVEVETEAAGGPPLRHLVTDDEVEGTLNAALQRIRAPAERMCWEMGIGVCTWNFRVLQDDSMNASAGPRGVIMVNRGIVDYADNEEQVAMVIAHEMGHQAANHIARGQRNQVAGALLGAVLLGALGAVATRGGHDSASVIRTASETGADVGAMVGRLSFSKEQEREADYLAAVILYRSGVDLDKARGFLVKIAAASGKRDTGMLDTHPAGPERLAAWDRAVQEIRASNGRLPPRA